MCGIAGIIGVENASKQVAMALQAIQHRGQDSAGIGAKKGNHFRLFKDIGLVHQIFDEKELNRLEGRLAVGHVRYPTIGGNSKEDAQPFYSRWPGIIMAHNGNITNFEEIKEYLLSQSIFLSSKCDIEPVLYILSNAIIKDNVKRVYSFEDVLKGLKETFKIVKGAYSLLGIMSIDGKDTMFVARDPYGIRPAVWGKKGDSYMVCSESVCMDVLDYEYMGSVKPGHVMFFREGEEPREFEIEKKGVAPCIFEYIYFARPDSKINDHCVYEKRMELGKLLADEFKERKKGIDFDVVIPIPDTSRPSAITFSEETGKPIREGFIKNRYSGRTFIMPTQGDRASALRLKLNPIKAEIKDKSIMLIDDSIVRGNTVKRIVEVLKGKGAKSVHLAIYSPPVINPCYYGIDMSTEEELIAYRMLKEMGVNCEQGINLDKDLLTEFEKKLADYFGLDSLTYLSIDRLNILLNGKRCAACFDGNYPVKVDEKSRRCIVFDRLSSRD